MSGTRIDEWGRVARLYELVRRPGESTWTYIVRGFIMDVHCDLHIPNLLVIQETLDAAATKVVETVDFRSPAGEDKKPKKEDVKVVHETKAGSDSSTGGGVLGAAAAAVTNTIESAKDLGAGAFESARGAGANTYESAKGISANAIQSANDAVSGTGKDTKTTE